MKKTLKIELVASFCIEFKLKYYKKSSKTIKFTTNFLTQHDSYSLVPSKNSRKITEFQSNKTEKLTKIDNTNLKIDEKF
jgi:hypothetical protein